MSAAGPVPGMRPGCLLFDAGQTLLYSRTSTVTMTALILEGEGLHLPEAAIDQAMRRADAFIESRWHVGPWWHHERAVRDLFTAGYRAGLDALLEAQVGDTRRAGLAEAIYEAYADPAHWGLYADVLPTLEGLRAEGLPLGIVSDWGESLPWLLHHLEIDDYFQSVVVSSRLGVGKPDPGLFHMALARLGRSPGDSWYVGDTYSKDVLGARGAGMHPFLIDRAGRHEGLDCQVIRSLLELLDPAGSGTPPRGSVDPYPSAEHRSGAAVRLSP